MVRVIIKGGVWKNTEDEILKAAIMKYGKNQWSRIASLLHRKSAKQCKARWQEWLDPRIKKTEWSREEDEKLLHLAKIMPTQWRTIAPVVGRTATQCLERYEQLLDEAQRRVEGLDEGEALREAKKLKPGEVDPTPETKPARPDPIDMDEDELEMLSEARARLANTQGKKAKRKAREKQLAEARRLASLQKRRELRAAGIYAGNGLYKLQKKGIIDFNAEVPFEKPVPAGFHDPTDDVFNKNHIKLHEEKRRDHIEAEARRADKKKISKRRAEENPETIFDKKQEHKRSKLVLPAPQVSDKELEDIVKIGQASDSVRNMIDDNPTSTLLHDYAEAFNNAHAARTLRTPAGISDSIAKAADDLLAITNAETPLLGGENAFLHSTKFTAPSSVRAVVQTPNTVLAAIAQTPKQLYDPTPGTVSATPGGATPFRDQLNINRDAGRASTDELRRSLKTLPAPKNDFEVIVPDDDDISNEDEQHDEMHVDSWTEDAGELDVKRAALLEKQKAKALALRSEVFRRKLPIPSRLNDAAYKSSPVKNAFDEADNMIRAEMRNLLRWDILNIEPVEMFVQGELDASRAFLDAESNKYGGFDQEFYLQKADTLISERYVVTNGQTATTLKMLAPKDQVKAIKAEVEKLNLITKTIKTKSEKANNKLKVILQGYEKIEDQAVKDIMKNQHESVLHTLEAVTFSELRHHENEAALRRIRALEVEVTQLRQVEADLQKDFADVAHQRWQLNQIALQKLAITTETPSPDDKTTATIKPSTDEESETTVTSTVDDL